MGLIRRVGRRVAKRVRGTPTTRDAGRPPAPTVDLEGLETPAAELLRRRADGEALLFIDIRPPHEREKIIPGDRNIPMRQLYEDWRTLRGEHTVVCYCVSGGYSVNAAEMLRERGVAGATCVSGGIDAWEDAGGAIAVVES